MGYGSVGEGRLRPYSSGLNRPRPMFYQSTKLRPLEEGSGLRGQKDGSQPGLGLKTAIDNKNFRESKFSQGIYYLSGGIDNKLFDKTNFSQINYYG